MLLLGNSSFFEQHVLIYSPVKDLGTNRAGQSKEQTPRNMQ